MATWRWARRLRPFMAWAAVSGALEASLPRLAAPAAFNSSECEAKRKPPNVERFLVLLDAGEQGNKNVAVVAEAASWARLLGRTFVEPAMCDSYVVSPYESKVERGNALPAVVGVHARTVSPCAHGNTPFSALRAMRGACAHVAVISIQDWRALVARPGTGPALRDDAYFHDRSEGPSKIGQTNAAPQQQEQRVLYVGCWFRSLSNSQISDGACTMKPCFDVFQFPYSTRLYDFVAKTTARAGKYACVQWRSEKHARATNVERCATELVNAADRALTAERIIGNRLDVPVLFVSDLYGSTSETYSRGDKVRYQHRGLWGHAAV